MNNKKGFTLIEIVICISLIVIIGVGSFVGIRLVNKKLLKDKLNQITDKATLAAQVYIETNKSVSNQLYQNKNGVSLPLQLLVNEGLLTLDGTKLESNDIKNQYVITFLGNTGSSGSDNCEKITSTTSWGNDKEIYLCMNSDGSSNLATIDPTKYSNKTNVTNEPYYFEGTNPYNYATNLSISCETTEWNGTKKTVSPTTRILSIDRNDDIIIALKYRDNYPKCINKDGNEAKSIYLSYNGNSEEKLNWLYTFNTVLRKNELDYNYFVRLPSSCKIVGGTGAYDKPFEIKC